MKWIVKMEVKDYVRNWSDQKIHTVYKGVSVEIDIKDLSCTMVLEGKEHIKEVFYLVWELLSLYDGYFYEPISYEVDEHIISCDELFPVAFYKTDKLWYGSELIGRAQRNLSTDVLEKYDKFRNAGISDKKMLKSLVNAFFYLNSESYGKINANHRLSLLLNIVDGFIINTFGETNNVKASYDRFFKKTIDSQKLKSGISLLGIDEDRYKFLLAGERNTFDHYIYSENNLTTLINDSEEEISNYVIWYFIYVVELVMRINILKEVGVILFEETINYALDSINDWLIYENNLDEECATSHYRMAQIERKLEIECIEEA